MNIKTNTMKLLHEITKEEALDTLRAGGSYVGLSEGWIYSEYCSDRGPFCKMERTEFAQCVYTFHSEDGITKRPIASKVTADGFNNGIDIRTSLKAHELGYYVPHLSDVLNAKAVTA